MQETSETYFKKPSSYRAALPQIIAVTVKNILLIGFGMTLGFPTILIPGLQSQEEKEMHFSNEQLSWIGSINLICVPLGCLLSGPLSQKIGRKRAMQIVNIPLGLTWLLLKFARQPWQIYLALCILGLLLGCVEAPVITYVAEITTPQLRGMLSSTSTMSMISGILLSFILGTFLKWREVAFISFIFPLLSINFLILIPESPHWLITKNRFLDARKSLAWLRGWLKIDDIEEEFQELCKNLDNATHISDSELLETPIKCKSINSYKLKSFLWPYSLITFLFFLRHFTGMTNIQTYAVDIFDTFQTSMDKYYAIIVLGISELLGCLLCVSLVRYIGKRWLTFGTMFLSGLCLFTIGTYSYIYDIKELKTDMYINTEIKSNISVITNYHWVPTGCLIAFAFFSHAGLRILPWILIGEIFSNKTRAMGAGLSAATGYIFGFIVNKIFFLFISMLTLLGIFWFYCGLTFIGILVLYFFLPETEGKTLQEISDYFTIETSKNVYNSKSRDSNFSEDWEISLDALNSYKKFMDLDTPVENIF